MRTYLTLFLSIFLSYQLLAQDWNTLYNEGRNAYTAKKYPQAIKSLETAQHIAESQFGHNSSKYRVTIEFLAKSYDETGQYDKSVILYKGLRDLLKNENKASSIEYADVQMALGYAYSKLFEKNRSLKDITDAQKEELYRFALEAYKSSYEIRKKNSQEKTNECINSLKGLATLSTYKKSEQKNAEKYFTELLEAIGSFQGKKSDAYLASLIDYADYLTDRKQYDNSFKLYEEHITTSEALKKPKKDILESYSKRAFCASKIGEKGTALKTHTEYLSAYETVNGLKNKDFIKIIEKSIKDLETLGFGIELEKLYNKKIEAVKMQFGEQSVEYGDALEDMGIFKIRLKQYDKAKEYIEKGISIFKSQKGEKSIEYINGSDILGRLYEQMNQFEKAEQIFVSNLELREKNFGQTSNECTFGMDSLGKYYLRRGKLVEADTMFSRSLRIRAVQPGKKHAYYGMALGNKADVHIASGKNEEAEKLLRQQIDVFKQHYGEVSAEVGPVIYKLAELYMVLKKPDDAMKLFKECISVFQSVSNESSNFYIEKSQQGFSNAQQLKSELNRK